jgi:D-alanine-D-alanine ligase
MDKDLTKRLLKEAGIPVAAGFVMRRGDPVPNVACYPVFVKPARLGSSVGISKVKNRQGLKAAVRAAFRYDDKILIEQAVPDAREIECAVLGNGPYRVSEFGEIIPSGEFYDFNSKYVDGASSCLLPAPIPKTLTKTLQAAARRACRVLGIEGLARIDFLVSRKTGEWVLNEPNTLPGFTSISMYPKLWLRQGLTYPHLIDTLIRLALERGRRRARLTTDFSSGSDWYVA